MIPRTFLSTYASNNQQQMAVVFLTDVTGLKRWADYIPVKLAEGGSENSYANNGYVDVVPVVKTSTMRPFAEYVPVYVDSSATDAWQVNATGYIPYGYAGFGDASMVMDFTNGAALDSRVTFTRSTTGTRTNASGLIESVAINGPRFNYNPTTLESLGLLIEEQRTNLVLQSQFASGWVNFGTNTTTANSATAPDGTTTAALVASSATSDYVYQVPATTIGVAYVFSFFVKNSTATISQYHIRSSNTAAIGTLTWSGATLSSVTPTVGTASFAAVGSDWYRVSVSYTATETAARHRIAGGDGVSTTGNILVWGAQLETGAFATSYIPTVASQVTRAADVAVMTGTNFSSWYNATQGTLFAQADWLGLSNNDYFFAINNGTANNLIAVGISSTPATRFIVLNGGTTQASISGPTPVANTPFKIAGAYQVNNFVAATNGTLGTVDTSGTVPSGMSEVSITSSYGTTANLFNGHILRLAYYNRRLTNAELQGITA